MSDGARERFSWATVTIPPVAFLAVAAVVLGMHGPARSAPTGDLG
jgi:hypothetical protein